jgi:hypothetical protein
MAQESSDTPVVPAVGTIVWDRHNGPAGGGLRGRVHGYVPTQGTPKYVILRMPDGSPGQWTAPIGYCDSDCGT